ncbi:uncharacterized protein [Ptychodera flava]|uniref:uncharacterized protein n=1 Tax=Ptychodera flava TaxID=63121 RepID=UPI00396A0FA8
MAIQRNLPLILQLLISCVECLDVEATSFFIEPYDVKKVLHESSLSVTSMLPCYVDHLQAGYSVIWYKNGLQISNNGHVYGNIVDRSRYTVNVFETSTWTRFNLKITTSVANADTDSGNYHCTVTTTPLLISRKARLDVFVTPKDGYLRCSIGDDLDDDNFDVSEGTEIKLSCRSDPTGVPEMTTYWTGEGPQGDTFDTVTTTSTDIRNGSHVLLFSWTPTNQQNGATFICTGFHPGYSTNRTCQLGPFNVTYRPIVQLSPASFTVTMETQVVNFTCRSDANPPVTRYVWSNTAGEKFSVQDDNVILDPHRRWMRMKHFRSQDNGVYNVTCFAENEVGRSLVNGTSTLTVNIQAWTTVKTVSEHLSTATSKLTSTNSSVKNKTVSEHLSTETSKTVSEHFSTETSKTVSEHFSTATSKTVSEDFSTATSKTVSEDFSTATSKTVSEDFSTATSKTVSEDFSTATSKTVSEDFSIATSKTVSEDFSTATSKTGSEHLSIATSKLTSTNSSVKNKTVSEHLSTATSKTMNEHLSIATSKTGSEDFSTATSKTASEDFGTVTSKIGSEHLSIATSKLTSTSSSVKNKTVSEHLSTATSKLIATSSKGNAHIPTVGQHDMTSATQVGASTSYYYGINETTKASQTNTVVIIGSAVAGCSFVFAVVVLVLITVCVRKSRKKSRRKNSLDAPMQL